MHFALLTLLNASYTYCIIHIAPPTPIVHVPTLEGLRPLQITYFQEKRCFVGDKIGVLHLKINLHVVIITSANIVYVKYHII